MADKVNKKAAVKVVKYEGSPNVFAWKYPSDELGTWTQVIVNEAQEAVLFKGGQALDIFGAGRHQLSTKNIPLLNRLINIPFGGESPFKAEIWYINKLYNLDIKWGTQPAVQLQDPKYGVFLPVRAFGQFGIQIAESKTFLTKLVGTVPQFDQENVTKLFRGVYLTTVQDMLGKYLVEKGVSVLEINARLTELSSYLHETLAPTFGQYGIRLLNFYCNNVNVPEDDPAVQQLKSALAKKAEMNVIGYDYTQERSFDALEGAAKNEGSGQSGIMGAAMGMGMGVPIGGMMGSQMAGLAGTMSIDQGKQCPKCGGRVAAMATFCPACGTNVRTEVRQESVIARDLVICDKCKEKFEKTFRFCPKCGDAYTPCPKCGADLNVKDSKCPECGEGVPHPCPKCGAELPNGAKFCGECGEQFGKKCPQCGAQINGTPKFCFECGTKLGE